jgi:hypothetical protein
VLSLVQSVVCDVARAAPESSAALSAKWHALQAGEAQPKTELAEHQSAQADENRTARSLLRVPPGRCGPERWHSSSSPTCRAVAAETLELMRARVSAAGGSRTPRTREPTRRADVDNAARRIIRRVST